MARLGLILPRLAAPLLGAAVVCFSSLVLRGDFLEDSPLPPDGASQAETASQKVNPQPTFGRIPLGRKSEQCPRCSSGQDIHIPLLAGRNLSQSACAVPRTIHRDAAVTMAAYPEAALAPA